MFKHFLFTRFNLELVKNDRKTAAPQYLEKSDMVRLDPEWLENRLCLLKTFTIPTIKTQRNRAFEWWILAHSDTPSSCKQVLSQISSNVFFTSKCDYDAAKEIILRESTQDWVISTNCDSDDGLSRDYISDVQRNFRERKEYLNIDFGVVLNCYNTHDFDEAQWIGKVSKMNPYRSLVESRDDCQSVYYVTHGLSEMIAPVRSIESNSKWLQVIHGDNLANRVNKHRKDKYAEFSEIRGEFGL